MNERIPKRPLAWKGRHNEAPKLHALGERGRRGTIQFQVLVKFNGQHIWVSPEIVTAC